MNDVDTKIDDILQHYGVKGMKWKFRSADTNLDPQDPGAGGGGGSEDVQDPEEKFKKIGDDLETMRSKVGDGPLDMLKYVLFGTTKKPEKKSDTLDPFAKKLKDIRSKIGNGPLDMLKYVLFGKRKVQHSGLNDDEYKAIGRMIVEDLIRTEMLQQSGIKGMHWGVRRNSDQHGGADGKPDAKDEPAKTTLGKKWNSLKRERQWHSALKEMESLTNKELTEITARITLENSLKTLSRSAVATKKDKQDYLLRGHMDTEELAGKVIRLRTKENLHKAVKSASKEQIELGQKIIHIGQAVSTRYVVNKMTGEKSGLGDLYETLKNPKGSADKATGDIKKELAKRGKELLDKAK